MPYPLAVARRNTQALWVLLPQDHDLYAVHAYPVEDDYVQFLRSRVSLAEVADLAEEHGR